MKVWPPGKHHRAALGMFAEGGARRRARTRPALADWVIRDENLLVKSRFGGDVELYRAWHYRLWEEMHDVMGRPALAEPSADGEEYVVMKAFGGDWAQYRVCRDRLREELWQIMKVARPR